MGPCGESHSSTSILYEDRAKSVAVTIILLLRSDRESVAACCTCMHTYTSDMHAHADAATRHVQRASFQSFEFQTRPVESPHPFLYICVLIIVTVVGQQISNMQHLWTNDIYRTTSTSTSSV